MRPQKLFQRFGVQLQTWLARVPIMKLRSSLLEDSKFNLNYLVLIASSCLLATFGLIINSTAVIIGAMIIAPLMLPLRGFAFAAIEGDRELLRFSSTSICLGTIIGIIVSLLTGSLLGIPSFGSEVLSRTQPTLIDLMIAIVAGVVSCYAKIRPEVGDALPGTAIAVALVPPLCVVGLTLSQGQWDYCGGAFLLYCTNLLGINLACTLVYVLAGYTRPDKEFSRTLSWSLSAILMAILLVPLGISSVRLVRQDRLNYSIRSIVSSNDTLSQKEVEVIQTRIAWRTSQIEVVVRAAGVITPEEVALLEQAIAKQTDRPFKIFLIVTPVEKVETR